jgi:hypothetical protein
MRSPDITTIRLELEALQDAASAPHPAAFRWTKELDALLLEHWPKKHQEAVSKAIGVSPNTARRRYRELTGNNLT